MTTLTASSHDVMRRAIAKLDPDALMQVVDALQLQGAKISAVVAVPLRSLQKKRDVVAFAASAPIDAVSGLLELVSMDPLEKIIAALGDHAEAPTYDQLSAALASLREELSTDQIVAVLAFAIGHDFPAGPHCRRLLSEDEALALPDLEITVGQTSLLSPKVVDESVREQRRRRREEEKARKQARAAKASAPRHPVKAKVEKKVVAVTPASAAAPTPVVDVTRREPLLTPAELALYDAHHPLAGAVVTTEVPFDAVDPMIPEQQSKIRPALVVAASDKGLLVRGIYSNPSPTRTVFSAWRRLGLDHVSYLEGARTMVRSGAEVTKLGVLTDAEWNALL